MIRGLIRYLIRRRRRRRRRGRENY